MKKIAVVFTMLFFNSLFAQVHAEKLHYEIRFGFIKGGEAVYQINENNSNGEIHATLHGYTTGFARRLYGVDDYFESFIPKDQNAPVRSVKKLKEKDYRYDEEITFDHKKGVAYSKKMGNQTIKSGVCDVSSIMYHLRSSGKLNNLKKNQVIEIPFWDTGEWYMLSLKYTGTEKIATSMGKKECLRLEPQKIPGRFFNKKNPMNLWITNDSNKWPVLMELNFTIGTVKCELNPPPPKGGE